MEQLAGWKPKSGGDPECWDEVRTGHQLVLFLYVGAKCCHLSVLECNRLQRLSHKCLCLRQIVFTLYILWYPIQRIRSPPPAFGLWMYVKRGRLTVFNVSYKFWMFSTSSSFIWKKKNYVDVCCITLVRQLKRIFCSFYTFVWDLSAVTFSIVGISVTSWMFASVFVCKFVKFILCKLLPQIVFFREKLPQ